MAFKFVEEVDESFEEPQGKFRFLEEEKEVSPQRGALEKGARIGTQLGLGIAERATMPLELAAAPLSATETQLPGFRHEMFKDIERLKQQKATGVFDESDQELLDYLTDQADNPSASKQFLSPIDVGARGLAEKISGQDLKPEGILEKSANWLGFIKKPSSAKELIKLGSSPKEVIKAILPTGKEMARSLGAGTALQMAESGEFGIIGTIASAIVGDLAGGGAAGLAKNIVSPKKPLAAGVAKLVSKSKLQTQKELITSLRDSGIQADIGTLTDNNLLKNSQTFLMQSGLTGDALDKLRSRITDQVRTEYTGLADALSSQKFETLREAGEEGKRFLVAARDLEKGRVTDLYNKAKESIRANETIENTSVKNTVDSLLKDLKPGSLKSSEQKQVVNTLQNLSKDLTGKRTSVDKLINTKVALNDIINYEVQGGQKKLLRKVINSIDESINLHGKENPEFVKKYKIANEKFSQHAKKFRNPNIDRILRSDNPELLMQKMNTIQGMRDVEKALSTTAPGRRTFKELQRLKLDHMIGDKMTDNVSEQLKSGTFANLLKNPKDKQLVREILGREGFSRLDKLQKNVGKMAASSQKFFNASKTAVQAKDLVAMGYLIKGFTSLLMGNPWTLTTGVAGMVTSRQLSKLISNPEFLNLVEEAILASEKSNVPVMKRISQSAMKKVSQWLKKSPEKFPEIQKAARESEL